MLDMYIERWQLSIWVLLLKAKNLWWTVVVQCWVSFGQEWNFLHNISAYLPVTVLGQLWRLLRKNNIDFGINLLRLLFDWPMQCMEVKHQNRSQYILSVYRTDYRRTQIVSTSVRHNFVSCFRGHISHIWNKPDSFDAAVHTLPSPQPMSSKVSFSLSPTQDRKSVV